MIHFLSLLLYGFEVVQNFFRNTQFSVACSHFQSGLGGTMEIGTAADAQAVFLSEGMHMAFFCLMVSAVNGFNAGQSVFGQSGGPA